MLLVVPLELRPHVPQLRLGRAHLELHLRQLSPGPRLGLGQRRFQTRVLGGLGGMDESATRNLGLKGLIPHSSLSQRCLQTLVLEGLGGLRGFWAGAP